MYKYLILFLTIVFTSNTQSQYVWEQIATYDNGFTKKICVFDSSNLILFSEPSLYQNIYKSTNGGYDWKLIFRKEHMGGKTASNILDIAYTDTNEILALYNNSKIIRFDGNGNPLDTIYFQVEGKNTTGSGQEPSIKMISKSKGTLSYNNQILVTNDSWKTYKVIPNAITYNSIFKNYFYFDDNNYGFHFNSLGKLVYTKDGGENFQEYDLPHIENNELYDIHFINDSIAYIGGYLRLDTNQQVNHFVYKTTTGGSEWFKVLDTILVAVYPNVGNFAMLNENEGMYFNSRGKLVTTIDGFKTIRVEQIDSMDRFYPHAYIIYTGDKPILAIAQNNAGQGGIYSWRDTLGLLAPKLDIPVNHSSIINQEATLRWQKDTEVKKYIVQVSTDKGFNNIVRNDTLEATSMSPVSNSIAISGLEHCKTYYWRVASNKDVYYKWSEVWSFSKILPYVKLFSPTDYSKIVENKVELNWYVMEGAEYYHLQCAYDSKFENIFFTTDTLKNTYFELTDLPEDTVFYWRVSANCKDIDAFHWSNTWQFRTPKFTSISSQANTNSIVFPNPAGDFINITIDSDEGLLASEIQILDLLGLVVSKSELTDGNNRIDISNLPRGTYFIKVGDKVDKFVKM